LETAASYFDVEKIDVVVAYYLEHFDEMSLMNDEFVHEVVVLVMAVNYQAVVYAIADDDVDDKIVVVVVVVVVNVVVDTLV